MRAECREKVSQILGRTVSEKEGKEIVKQIGSAMKRKMIEDENFRNLSKNDQAYEIAKELAARIKQQAQERAEANLKTVIKQSQILNKKKDLAKQGIHSFSQDARILTDAEYNKRAVFNEAMTGLSDMLCAIDSNYFGLLENPEHVQNFLKAAFGERTTVRAQKGWNAFKQASDKLFERARKAGLISGYLENYIPQNHDVWRLVDAGEQKWVDDMIALVDRERYLRDDGAVMSDSELREVLSSAYKNLITDGNPESSYDTIVQQRTVKKGLGGLKHYESRVLHFKNADAWARYHSQYGKGSLSGMLIGHIQKLASDVATLEALGPNPEATFNFMKDISQAEADNAAPRAGFIESLAYSSKVGLWRVDIDDVWKNFTGEANRVGNSVLAYKGAQIMQGWRNLEVAGKLGKAFITSFSDLSTLIITSRFNRMNTLDTLSFIYKSFGDDWKSYANRVGLIADSLSSDFNRWSGDNLGYGWTSRVANATLKASLLTGWTDGVRRAFSLNMLASFGNLIKKSWKELDAYDRARLEDGGISEADFEVLRSVGIDSYKGVDFLNMQALREANEQVSTRVLSFIIKESEMASLNPDLVTRSEMNRGAQKGTLAGEFARSFYLFKSFPTAMMEKSWRRAKWLNQVEGRPQQIQYLANMMIWTTVMGMVSLQVQNLLNGKDFRDMETKQFWFDAFTKGGGAGFLGDFVANMISENPRYGAWGAAQLLGPVVGSGLEASDLIAKTIGNGLYDKENQAGSAALKLIRSHTPFVNLWYTSSVLDRVLFNQLNEMMSPGYISRMESRNSNMYGQGYWWNNRKIDGVRAPRFSNAPE